MLPEGVLIDGADLASAIARTQALLADPATTSVFEATFAVDGVLVRVDILEADGRGGWRVIEVKSTTDVKREHRGDLATQVWAAAGAGVRVSGAALRHIDRTFVLLREGDYLGAFVDKEMLGEVRPVADARPLVVALAKATLDGPEPSRTVGPHCSDPHHCPFTDHCRSTLPAEPEWPVTVLPNGGGKRWLEAGVTDLLDVDPRRLKSPNHLRVHQATVSGATFHDLAGACSAIEAWPFPRIWLDFETIAFPLPRWLGTHPYEQVPFQFSAHIEHEGGRLEHREFLSLDGSDPLRPCAVALGGLPAVGAVVAYSAPFERGCLERLAAAVPDLSAELLSLAARLVDLLPVTRATWYHRDQRGSWSIKAVLPTVTDLTYQGLEVKDGMAAQAAYLESIGGATPERINILDAALPVYCGRDTEAMIAVARRLISPT